MFSFLVLVVALSLYKHFDYKVSGEGGEERQLWSTGAKGCSFQKLWLLGSRLQVQ